MAAKYAYIVLLAIWLGGMVSLSFVLAPTAFSLLPTRTSAVSFILSSLIKKSYTLSYVIVLLMLLCGGLLSAGQPHSLRYFLSKCLFIIGKAGTAEWLKDRESMWTEISDLSASIAEAFRTAKARGERNTWPKIKVQVGMGIVV